jgi:hypothetical protein
MFTMPLIDTATLLKVADRAAYQYGQIKTTLAAVNQVGTGYYWTTITATEDADVELPLQQVYYNVDQDFAVALGIRGGTNLPNIVFGMENHFNRPGPSGNPLQLGGWDGYLQSNNKRVSQYFGELFYISHGFYMLAVDVFSEGVDDFATAVRNAVPGITFTDGVNYGNGNVLNPANGVNFAATQLKVYVVSMGGTNLDLRLSVKDVNNNPTTIDVTIPGGSPPGTEVAIGTAADRFLDVTNIILKPAGSAGTLGDNMKVRNLKERQIAL